MVQLLTYVQRISRLRMMLSLKDHKLVAIWIYGATVPLAGVARGASRAPSIKSAATT